MLFRSNPIVPFVSSIRRRSDDWRFAILCRLCIRPRGSLGGGLELERRRGGGFVGMRGLRGWGISIVQVLKGDMGYERRHLQRRNEVIEVELGR